MTEDEARKILGEMVQPDGSLAGQDDYIDWEGYLDARGECMLVDGWFSADQFEAIAFWMRTFGPAQNADKPRTAQ